MRYRSFTLTAAVSALVAAAATQSAQAVVFHSTDGTIDGSLCVGLDCPVTPNFGFTTLLLMENNLRIKFDDTSSTASFPNQDWSLEANESSNGGRNAFFLRNCGVSSQGNCSGNAVFTVEAGARNNALFVEDDGDIGVGTSTPAVDIHIQTGNTPTLRLAQDGTSGFTPQTWDVAGNETNFFIRDATNGSTLPIRIRPGASTSALDIAAGGDIGMNTASPTAKLHIRETGSGGSNADITLKLENTSGAAQIALISDSSGSAPDWRFQNFNGDFRASLAGTGVAEMTLDASGNLTITGALVTTGGGGACTVGDPCDAVFDPALYTVPSIEEHAAAMWQKKHLPAVGPTGPGQPIDVTEKMLRMLNELEHAHIYIEQLHRRVSELEALLAERG